MKPYPAYKPTGLKWLPEVPQGWDVLHIRELFSERRVKVSDKDYPPLSVSRGGIVPQIETVAKSDDGDNRKLVKRGDFVINSRSDRKSSSGVSQLDGSVSLINIVLEPREQLAGAYAHYLLKCHDFAEEFYRNGRGIVGDLWTTRYSEMKSISLPIPTLEEQASISAYLDAKTAKFDRLIKLKEREIELLQEKKQTVISTVVKRGLDPNVKLVDSGVAWLGKIPQGWKVVPFKTLFRFGKGLMITKDNLTETGESVISYGQIHSKTNSGVHLDSSLLRHVPAALTVENSRLNRGDIVFADTSEDIPGCGNCVLIDTDENVYAGYHTLIARAVKKECSPYLAALFQSVPWRCQIWKKVNGVKVFSVTQKVFSGVTVFIPPPEEQRKIVAYLDAEAAKTDKAIAAVTRQIALLKEYRTRLISDAVTGRIDLREAVA